MLKSSFSVTTLFVLALFLYSCSKTDETYHESDSDVLRGQELLLNLNKLEDTHVQQLSYTALSDIERYQVWNVKLSEQSKNNYYSVEQRVLINEVLENITPEIFAEGSERQEFMNYWFPNWIDLNADKFEGNELYFLFFTIDNSSPLKDSEYVMNTTGSESDCKCAVGSSFTCYSGHAYWGDCEKLRPCIESPRGCGALFDAPCDGTTCVTVG